jgi:tetratricopeptide (TPR) repeat protein
MKHQISAVAIAILSFSPAYGQTGGQTDPAALVKEGQKLEFSGQRTEAMALYKKALEQNPSQFDAYLGIGRILDMDGKYADARQHIQKAIDLAPETGQNPALSTMGVAYVFEGNAAESAKYYQKVFDRQIQAGAPDAAAGTANALGRVYLETGDVASAEKWYRTGYETAQKIEKRSAEDVDLWEMRWQHAQARIAARRKQSDAARKHVESVRAIVEKGTLDDFQKSTYPYLTGYVAFYEGKTDDAIAELSKADQDDPFILSLLAQAYEQKNDQARARELYKKILEIPGHSLQVAFSRPLAARRLGAR